MKEKTAFRMRENRVGDPSEAGGASGHASECVCVCSVALTQTPPSASHVAANWILVPIVSTFLFSLQSDARVAGAFTCGHAVLNTGRSTAQSTHREGEQLVGWLDSSMVGRLGDDCALLTMQGSADGAHQSKDVRHAVFSRWSLFI